VRKLVTVLRTNPALSTVLTRQLATVFKSQSESLFAIHGLKLLDVLVRKYNFFVPHLARDSVLESVIGQLPAQVNFPEGFDWAVSKSVLSTAVSLEKERIRWVLTCVQSWSVLFGEAHPVFTKYYKSLLNAPGMLFPPLRSFELNGPVAIATQSTNNHHNKPRKQVGGLVEIVEEAEDVKTSTAGSQDTEIEIKRKPQRKRRTSVLTTSAASKTQVAVENKTKTTVVFTVLRCTGLKLGGFHLSGRKNAVALYVGAADSTDAIAEYKGQTETVKQSKNPAFKETFQVLHDPAQPQMVQLIAYNFVNALKDSNKLGWSEVSASALAELPVGKTLTFELSHTDLKRHASLQGAAMVVKRVK
jgi:hypothetical protein